MREEDFRPKINTEFENPVFTEEIKQDEESLISKPVKVTQD